jgi:hypothetical protein
VPEDATVVTALNKVHQSFGGEFNSRDVTVDVDFPEDGCWTRIGMRVKLTCPDGGCDPWDRLGILSVIDHAGRPDEAQYELGRYVTPYGVGMCFHSDVTMFAPLLRGNKKILSHIGTWANPGWKVTVTFIFRPGTPEPNLVPEQMVQLWSQGAEVGNPENPIASQLAIESVHIPDWVTRAEVRMLTTGHGQGNTGNCAEFCKLNQLVSINGVDAAPYLLWRNDCGANPLRNQAGTWRYNRAGWCPGAYVLPKIIDVTDKIQPGQPAEFGYDILDKSLSAYVNTCRPDASPCRCPGGIACDYNTDGHTKPKDVVSAQLLLYR